MWSIARAIRLILLSCLLTGHHCHSLGREANRLSEERYPPPKPETIQICGPKLTSIIVDMCRGYVSSPVPEPGKNSNASGSGDLDYGGVVKLCCVNRCHRKDLLQHCGRSSNLTTMAAKEKGSIARKEAKERVEDRGNAKREAEADNSDSRNDLIGSSHKVRLRKTKPGKGRRRGANRKQSRKKLFKTNCVYKSFGHYLLALDRDKKIRNKIRKVRSVSLTI